MAFYDEYSRIQLKDKDGKILMPRTTASSTYFVDGETLEEKWKDVDQAIADAAEAKESAEAAATSASEAATSAENAAASATTAEGAATNAEASATAAEKSASDAASDAADAKSTAEEAKSAAEEAASDAAEAKTDAAQAKTDAEAAVSTANEAKQIAEGKASAKVFDTKADMDTWLADEDNVKTLHTGDNLYIIATDVPDYWWDGTQAQELETQKVSLDDYYTSDEVDGLLDDKVDVVDGKGLSTNDFTNEYKNMLDDIIQYEIIEEIGGETEEPDDGEVTP